MNERLEQLAGGYFHEDYQLEFGKADEALLAFRDGFSAEFIHSAADELDVLLASRATESELDDLWINQLGANYDPRDDGLTYREWFAHVRDLLTQAKAD